MREIQFRAKADSSIDKWVYGFLKNDFTINEVLLDGTLHGFNIIPETIGEYIGKKDINKNALYVGDIIDAFIIEDNIATMGEIVFDDYFLFYASKNLAGNTPLYKLTNIKRIGNKVDNPELLELKNEKNNN